MKLLLSFVFAIVANLLFSQSFLTKQLDHFFPNRKSKQIERLNTRVDSLQRSNDSLTLSVNNAAEKIVHLKKEIITLKTDLFNEKENSKGTQDQLQSEVAELLDSINKISFTLVTCTEESNPGANAAAPIITNRCTWRFYQIIEKGTPDYKGRYNWNTEIFSTKSGSAIKVSNTDLFKAEKLTELEAKVNARFEEDFQSFKAGTPGCFYTKKTFTPFTISQMRLAFNDNSEIIFEADFGLTDNCYAVSATSTGFKISELREFFSE
jgi:hypothetical protein